MLSPPVEIDGRFYLDGGVADPIPLGRSIDDGNGRNVVVLTRNEGYRKTAPHLGPLTGLTLRRTRRCGRRWPSVTSSTTRPWSGWRRWSRSGEAFVLRPLRTLEVGRMERDTAKLEALYRQGYDETVERLPDLRKWLAASSV